MPERVAQDSLLTLHYRLSTADDTEVVSTFATTPATLQLGSGELVPTLEQCLIGLQAGERHVFLLEPDQAFGAHNPDLVQRVARAELPDAEAVALHGTVQFAAPGGGSFAGLVRALDDDSATIDFNHPLAGQSVRFEVEVLGIL
jgi:FKBP-type peptidyl-prolyl cis-trans isomerase SlpA